MINTTVLADKDLHDNSEESWFSWFRWVPTSNEKLVEAERTILNRCACSIEKLFLPIVDSKYYLRTVVARNYPRSNDTYPLKDSGCENNIPIVLLHGFASGVGLWCKNLDSLSSSRRVYAFDNLGFGRSSRPEFPEPAEEVEAFFVETIEEWRMNMGLDNFILIGHSMGGFLAASYAIAHSTRVKHLILVDPWGFVGHDENPTVPLTGFRGWVSKKLRSFRALSTMRMAGPFGPKALRKVRQDFEHVYFQTEGQDDVTPCNSLHEFNVINGSTTDSPANVWADDQSVSRDQLYTENKNKGKSPAHTVSPFDPAVIYNYIYHINTRHPSGEDAFLRMSHLMGWAARPMLRRIPDLDNMVPITFIYGGRSWINMSSGLRAKNLRPEAYVDVMVIEGGGHHAYAQYAEEFNAYVNGVAHLVDIGFDFAPGNENLAEAEVAKHAQKTKSFVMPTPASLFNSTSSAQGPLKTKNSSPREDGEDDDHSSS